MRYLNVAGASFAKKTKAFHHIHMNFIKFIPISCIFPFLMNLHFRVRPPTADYTSVETKVIGNTEAFIIGSIFLTNFGKHLNYYISTSLNPFQNGGLFFSGVPRLPCPLQSILLKPLLITPGDLQNGLFLLASTISVPCRNIGFHEPNSLCLPGYIGLLSWIVSLKCCEKFRAIS